MLSRVITKKRRGRRWLAAGAAVGLVVATLAVAGFAFAVHDEKFQLDGNVLNNCPAGLTTCDAATQKDWQDLFTVTDDATAGTETVANSSVFSASGPFTSGTFIRDFESGTSCTLNSLSTTKFCTADDTTFATGSKDTLDITGWECNHDNNVNSKIDIMNAYAASYTAANGDKIMYFGLEKNKDNGTNDVGFWFLQGNASCSAPTGHKPWTGKHATGDVLVVSEFTNGGGVSNITAYKWVGGANPLQQIATATGTGGDCKTAAGADNICATTNSGANPFNTTLVTPWLTADATGGIGTNKIVPPDFFEGGINLTKVFQQSGSTVPSCFNTFIADTRSSNVTSSTLFDYARGSLGECKTTVTTKRGETADPPLTGEVNPPATIGGGSVSSGTDTANLTITGTNNWSGTLTFALCGPDANLTTCDQSKGVIVTTKPNVTANGNYVSDAATLTSAGKYCWSAHFEPSQASKDAGISSGDDNGANECFTVAAVTPSLDTCSGTYSGTTCTPAGTVTFGSAITDRAIVSGLAKEPGSNGGNTNYPTINATDGAYAGTLTFTLKGPSTTGCGSTAASSTGNLNPQTLPIDTTTGNKSYGPVSYTPAAPGNYHWQASLTNTATVNNILPVAHNGTCTDTDEDVTVQQIPTGVITKQSWIPNDTATISSQSGTLASGGSVVFELWNTATCDGTRLYTETVSVPGGSASAEVSTTNTGGATGFKITTGYADAAASTKSGYSWKVTYTPGAADTAHLGSSSSCAAENFSITYTNDNTP